MFQRYISRFCIITLLIFSISAVSIPVSASAEASEPVSPGFEIVERPPLTGQLLYETCIRQSCEEFGIEDWTLVMGVVEVESNWDPNVISSSGACGLMQIIPAYARKEMAEVGANDILDPCQNIRVGTKLLANLIERYNGNVTAALMFYNEGYAGPARYFRTGKPSNYATKVLKIAQGYREEVPYATGCEAYS